MSNSPLRIVLVDPLGDVLFSGESLSMMPRETSISDEDEERCPRTMRSAPHESGTFPSVGFADDDAPDTLPENVCLVGDEDEIRTHRTYAA